MVGLYLQFATATSPRQLLLMLHCVWISVINVIHSIAADINPDTSVAVCPSPSSSRLGMGRKLHGKSDIVPNTNLLYQSSMINECSFFQCLPQHCRCVILTKLQHPPLQPRTPAPAPHTGQLVTKISLSHF